MLVLREGVSSRTFCTLRMEIFKFSVVQSSLVEKYLLNGYMTVFFLAIADSFGGAPERFFVLYCTGSLKMFCTTAPV